MQKYIVIKELNITTGVVTYQPTGYLYNDLTGGVTNTGRTFAPVTVINENDFFVVSRQPHQSLSLVGRDLTLSDGGGTITIPAQNLSLAGNNLTLSDGGGTVVIPTGGVNVNYGWGDNNLILDGISNVTLTIGGTSFFITAPTNAADLQAKINSWTQYTLGYKFFVGSQKGSAGTEINLTAISVTGIGPVITLQQGINMITLAWVY